MPSTKRLAIAFARQAHQNQPFEIRMVRRDSIPEEIRSRGRKSLLTEMPGWNSLVSSLQKGLTRAEAVEIDLTPGNFDGKKISLASLIAALRHQLRKLDLHKKYSFLQSKKNDKLFIVDHETHNLMAA